MPPTHVYPTPWQIAEGFRRAVLIVLGVIALFMGAMIIFDAPVNGPSFKLFSEIPGWPQTWGGVLCLTGLLQLTGIKAHQRVLGIVGCTGSAIWYLSFAATFIVQWAQWVDSNRVTPDPSIYPFVPYLGYGALHVIGVVVLFLLWSIARKREDQ